MLLFATACDGSGRDADHADHAASARMIEARLLAPCCWVQTLDVHDSPLASELRAEIERRARAGESAEAIENDIAARYGERVRTVPLGSVDPTRMVPAIVVGALLASLVMIVLAVRRSRWRPGARGRTTGERHAIAEPMGPATRDDLDRRIDEELEELDDA
ncbi:MAG: cytochrome c-type biogenesis protein CcmH [Sandaracinaceae bacterium]